MGKPRNIALLWALLIALPMQGYATAAMLCCRSSDGTVFASSAAAAAHAQATARAETHTAHHQSDSDTAPVHATSCVTCMACCVACLGLLVWSAITIAQGSLRPVSTETVLPELSGYEGPYRPPRHILG